MSKRIQARVRQRTQATTDGSAPASSRYASLLERTFAIYQSGGTELPTDLAAEWEAALAADRESLLAFIVQPIAAGLIEPRLAQLVLGSDNKYTALATDWAAVAAFTGYRPAGFNRYESGKSLDALAAKQSGAMTPATGSWAAMAAAMEAQRGMGAMLRAWHEREFRSRRSLRWSRSSPPPRPMRPKRSPRSDTPTQKRRRRAPTICASRSRRRRRRPHRRLPPSTPTRRRPTPAISSPASSGSTSPPAASRSCWRRRS